MTDVDQPLRDRTAANEETATSMFARLMALSHEAARNGQYEVAYHALAAAMHSAELNQNLTELAEVAAVCAEQAAAVEAVKPAHSLSQSRAAARGTHPIYKSLADTIRAVTVRLQQQNRQVGDAGAR